MNTRIFKDIEKYQNRVFLGMTFRQLIFVVPSSVITFIVLGINMYYFHLGDWFTYGFVLFFTAPIMSFGIVRPNDINLEIFIKHFLNWHFSEPIRFMMKQEGEELEKDKKFKETISWEELN